MLALAGESMSVACITPISWSTDASSSTENSQADWAKSGELSLMSVTKTVT